MINTTIAKYKITRLIGEGGMASVFEAEHEMLGTKVAIKVLSPILSANDQIKERFRNEARLMASLNHPNITKMIDFVEQPQHLSIIMEFLSGENLSQKIKRCGPLPEDEIINYFSQALSAFHHAHEMGVIHRDVKPSNIFILGNGQVKILDFGIAKLYAHGQEKVLELTQTGYTIGTPVYMSPEQVKSDKTIDHRTDIYSLGISMYFAVHGKPPYDPSSESQFEIYSKIVNEPIQSLVGSGKLRELIQRACQKNRSDRFQNCLEWMEALKEAKTNSSFKNADATSEKTIVESNNVVLEIKGSSDEEKNVFSVILTNCGANKLSVVNIVKNFTGLGLKESKDLVDGAPNCIKYYFSKAEAEFLTLKLREAGAQVEIRYGSPKTLSDKTIIQPTDDISFRKVQIGNQTWMAENLNVDRFRNGDLIPEARTEDEWHYASVNRQPAWCYYDDKKELSVYLGKLYNWYAVNDLRGLAPLGWHIPSDQEWSFLASVLGGGKKAGKKLKSLKGWKSSFWSNGNGNNETGFEGQPGGIRLEHGSFGALTALGCWWTSTNDTPESAWFWILSHDSDALHKTEESSQLGNGLSVRCVMDKV